MVSSHLYILWLGDGLLLRRYDAMTAEVTRWCVAADVRGRESGREVGREMCPKERETVVVEGFDGDV